VGFSERWVQDMFISLLSVSCEEQQPAPGVVAPPAPATPDVPAAAVTPDAPGALVLPSDNVT